MVERVRIAIVGSLGTPSAEEWSISTHWSTNLGASPDQGILQGWLTAAAGGVITTLGSGAVALRDLLSTAGTVERLEAYAYGPSGPAVASAVAPVNVVGTGTIRCPFQTAVCFSLRTALPGQAGRGRSYWPALNAAVAATGKRNVQGNIAEDYAELLNAIAIAAPDLDPILSVYSPSRNLLTTVTAIQSGDVLDTQRRRRDSLVELYQSSPV